MSYRDQWLTVSMDGLEKTLARRGKAWLVYELVQNALDAGASTILIELTAIDRCPQVDLVVTDDVPDGWRDITHSWTMYAESEKKGDADKAGKFNLGEKLVLACCSTARIVTTKAAVLFDEQGRSMLRQRRAVGSEFRGVVRMTREELVGVRAACRRIIGRPDCDITLNGETLPSRTLVASIETTLPTEIADAEGVLRSRERKCTVDIYEPLSGETPSIYELGIPVVETEDRYHVDVRQRVPVSLERDNVPPAYLRRLRAQVLNATASRLTTGELARAWVTNAITDSNMEPAPLRQVMTARFGAGAVAYDPSDKGSNAKALSHGVQVVHGGSLPGEAWERIREHRILAPAGQVYPDAPKTFLACPDVEPSEDERAIMGWCRIWGERLLLKPVRVRLIDEARVNSAASWTRATSTLTLNRGHLGPQGFFEGGARGVITEAVIALAIHEFAHDFSVGDADDHLSAVYYEACCTIGARMALLLMTKVSS